MRLRVSWFVPALLLFPFTLVRGNPQSAVPASGSGYSTTPANALDCEKRPASSTGAVGGASSGEVQPAAARVDAAGAAPAGVNLDFDLKFLGERQSRLADCVVTLADGTNPTGENLCPDELLLNFEMRHSGDIERDIPIGQIAGSSAFFYESGMTIDADGAPNAYHPDNLGLDDLANAGAPGRWEGLAKGEDGEPFIQGPDDPFPGYYVSSTALADHSKAVNDPARYVDASKIPFLVLPGGLARQLGTRPGDFAVVFNERNGRSSYAIFADVGPHDRIGEGSVALAENLGVHSDARNGGAHRGIVYLIFPGSGNGRPRTIKEINTEGQRLLLEWESALASAACAEPRPATPREQREASN